MLYKLYVVTNKIPAEEAKGLALFKDFKNIYSEYDVQVIGVWVNTENPYEVYLMTAFKDEAHYESFVNSMSRCRKFWKRKGKESNLSTLKCRWIYKPLIE